MTSRDQDNLMRFLRDLAQPSRADLHNRASARLRGDRFTPSPEATDGLKRPQTATGKRAGANSRGPLDA